MWNLPGLGIKPMSPALAGKFLCTASPGKSWSVVFDVTIVIALGCHELCLCKTVNLISKRVCPDYSTDKLLPHFCLPPWASLFLRFNNVEIRPVKNRTVDSRCWRERQCLMSHVLNQKLKMSKLSEKGMSKAKRGQNARTLVPVSQSVNAEKKWKSY